MKVVNRIQADSQRKKEKDEQFWSKIENQTIIQVTGVGRLLF